MVRIWHAICYAWHATGKHTMRANFFAVTVLSTLLTITSAPATVLIRGDIGGMMENYVARFQQVRQSGEPVAIDGEYYSACTMLLGLLPRDQVCATPNAVLGFHAAWQFDKSGARVASASGTRDLMKTYPASVRGWLARHGGLTPDMKFVRGRDLAAIVAPCDKASREASSSPARRASRARQAQRVDLRRAQADAR
jgi:hypothetical protein